MAFIKITPWPLMGTVQSPTQINHSHSTIAQVLYWRPEADGSVRNVEITKDIEGCPATGCTLEQFIARSKPYEMLPSAKEVDRQFNGNHIIYFN
jgi:hypothetical protein